MKIAIMHCRDSSTVCTGAGCLRAYNQGLKHFAQYGENKPELCAFLDCGGCGIDRATDPGMLEKMEALQKIGVEKVHLGVCINEKCPSLANILQMLDRFGSAYEFGTH